MTEENKIKVLAWAVIELSKEIAFLNPGHEFSSRTIIANIEHAMESTE